MYPIRFFLMKIPIFSYEHRFFLKMLQNAPEYSMSSPIRSFIFGQSYVPIIKTFPRFFFNRSFEGVEPPEGPENVPEIMTGIFLQLVSAPLNWMH